MSGIHPETPDTHVVAGAATAPVSHDIAAEIIAMNNAFLELLTSSAVGPAPRVLGLEVANVTGLRELRAEQRARLAQVPLLLADFAALSSNGVTAVNEYKVADADIPVQWQEQVSAFANRLLATLWHFSRSDVGPAGYCMGLGRHAIGVLAEMSFAELSARSEVLCASLHARHADHPDCWPDLIHLAASDELDRLSAARLAMIPLTVATLHSSGASPAAR